MKSDNSVKKCVLIYVLFVVSQGSDLTMLQKMNQHHSGNKTYVASKHERDTDFGIHHFAGVVYYDSKGTKAKSN